MAYTQQNDNTYVQRREIKEFSIPDDIKLQAALKGMTVEEYLKFVDESSKNAKQSGVIVDGSNPQPFKAKVSKNPNEQARIAESEEKAKKEANKVVDTILNLSLPSTYVNAGLQATGKEKLPEWGSLAVDFAPMVLGIGAGALKQGLKAVSKKVGLKFSKSDSNNLFKIAPEYKKFIQDNPHLDPNSQEAVDAFLKIQGRSTRGVFGYNDIEEALTQIGNTKAKTPGSHVFQTLL